MAKGLKTGVLVPEIVSKTAELVSLFDVPIIPAMQNI